MLKYIAAFFLMLVLALYLNVDFNERNIKESAYVQLEVKEESVDYAQEISQPTIKFDTSILPESLSGTKVDGGLRVDANGNFIPSYSTIRMFNYFFSTVGEESKAQIYERIQSVISNTLLSPAKEEAEEFLDQFVLYKRRVKALLSDSIDQDMDNLEQAEALAQLRREIFGEAVSLAIFAREDLVRSVDIRKNKILESDAYTSEEKERLVEALNKEYPSNVVAYRERASAFSDLYEETKKMRKEGASSEALYEYRKNLLGEEGARRLAGLDVKRNEFQKKLDDYRAFKNSISGLSVQSQLDMDLQWLKNNASSSEAIRLRALQ